MASSFNGAHEVRCSDCQETIKYQWGKPVHARCDTCYDKAIAKLAKEIKYGAGRNEYGEESP